MFTQPTTKLKVSFSSKLTGQEEENSKARKPSTSDGFFVIGRNVFSTREILVSLI